MILLNGLKSSQILLFFKRIPRKVRLRLGKDIQILKMFITLVLSIFLDFANTDLRIKGYMPVSKVIEPVANCIFASIFVSPWE